MSGNSLKVDVVLYVPTLVTMSNAPSQMAAQPRNGSTPQVNAAHSAHLVMVSSAQFHLDVHQMSGFLLKASVVLNARMIVRMLIA